LLFLLLSGGASSLMPAPVSGVTLSDKRRVTDQLLRCGADIVDVNCVRKHLSTLKGGRLAALSRATVVTLVLSDVIGDDLSAIGSGPTAPDPTTYRDAVACLRRHRLWSSLPPGVREHLSSGVKGRVADTPKPGADLFRRIHHEIIGNNAMALSALTAAARLAGWRTLLLPPFTKDAREAGAEMGALARRILMQQRPVGPPCCVVATDGSDGPTDAAGALVNGETWPRAVRMGINLDAALIRNDTYRALKRLNGHIMTGPTGTNVNDLYLLFVF
jgi:glycerate-2-kinase